MSLHEQLPLRMPDNWRDLQVVEASKAEMKAIISAVTLKEAAYELGENASSIAHAFDPESRHVVKFDWLPWALRRAPTPKLLTMLAAHAHHDVRPHEPLTAEQWRERMQSAIGSLPEPLRRALLEQAFGPGVTR